MKSNTALDNDVLIATDITRLEDELARVVEFTLLLSAEVDDLRVIVKEQAGVVYNLDRELKRSRLRS